MEAAKPRFQRSPAEALDSPATGGPVSSTRPVPLRPGAGRVTVGYVHVGPPEHGVTRYGHLLATAARASSELNVMEAELGLTADELGNVAALRKAAHALAGADVIHLQYNNQLLQSVWGRTWRQVAHLYTLARCAGIPLIITMHDVAERSPWRGKARFALGRVGTAAERMGLKLSRTFSRSWIRGTRPASTQRELVDANLGSDALALWWVRRRAELLLVCSEEERRRIETFVPGAPVRVIPHFVEARSLSTARPTAKEALGLGGRRVVTLLGYVHPRKGHELLIDALQSLPADVTAVFAGTTEAVHLPYVAHLREKAVAAGAAGRLRITGFLPEAELEMYLAATDLAVCPFTTVAASGSVSTWLSAGTPILAADLPLIAEYNLMEPGAIRTFSPYTANALAEVACNLLAASPMHDDSPAKRLRSRLRMDSVLQQHIEAYRDVAEKRAAQGSGA